MNDKEQNGNGTSNGTAIITTAPVEKKRFLFVSLIGLCTDVAWQVQKEGHEVKLFIESDDDGIGDGFFEKVKHWKEHVDWADVVVFDDVQGQGSHAKRLRAQGKLVFGGTPYTDQLEDDRAFGQVVRQQIIKVCCL
jgi:phosphoribosylamine---glycine ligase